MADTPITPGAGTLTLTGAQPTVRQNTPRTPVWRIWELPTNADVYGNGRSTVPITCPWTLVTVTWSNVNSWDPCTPAPVGYLQDRSVQVSGTTIGSVAIQGSQDNLEYFALNDPQGNALTALAAGMVEALLEGSMFVKPVVTSGTAVDVTVFGRIPVV